MTKSDVVENLVSADDKFLPVSWAESEFERVEKSEGVSPLFGTARSRALEAIVRKGIPTTRVEDWKYTNANNVAKQPHVISKTSGIKIDPSKLISLSISGAPLVLVNGKYDPALSSAKLPEGFEAAALSQVIADSTHPLHQAVSEHLGSIAPFADDQIIAFNTALARDGIVIRVKKGAVIESALELLFISGGQVKDSASFPRVLIIAEPHSQAAIIETYAAAGDQPYLTSAVTEIVVNDEASLTHTKIQLESLKATHFGRTQVRQGRASRFSSRVFHFGGAVVRNEVNPVLNGEGIDTTLFGLSVIAGTQHVDNHTTLDHAKPHSQSTEIYKGIYGEKSRGVFCGTIIVRQDAQKTNAIQSNNAILLSDEAEIDSKPQLTIYADDVKCTHGATVGQLDDQALFYLRSRGIDQKTARGMLIRAFAEDVVARIEDPKLNEFIEQKLVERLDSIL